MTVMILDRPRHEEIVDRVRQDRRAGLPPDRRRRRRRDHGRRGAARAFDLLYGIGGTPEGVVAAAALKCLGGVDPGPALSPR